MEIKRTMYIFSKISLDKFEKFWIDIYMIIKSKICSNNNKCKRLQEKENLLKILINHHLQSQYGQKSTNLYEIFGNVLKYINHYHWTIYFYTTNFVFICLLYLSSWFSTILLSKWNSRFYVSKMSFYWSKRVMTL